ncbi:hypothetical protein [Butyrivibrio hungatei]|uniref:Uncharacterized protein n=1 Tax=Butyrivibrio hungatei TaxID=185008 RepID=A0A1D9P5U4_9FIRM|nr:hypothetical protein [Butyrivibrio hungatei]AOZ97911.1 hypothetical protein bhn_II112 [Butyrivibrio hungatei]
MTYTELFSLEPLAFLTWLDKTFPTKVPDCIDTVSDMTKAAGQLLMFTNEYAYISELSSLARILTRKAKREGRKTDYEDMVDKRDAIENKMSAIKQCYQGVSRSITVRSENNEELRMLSSRYVA